MYTEIKPLDNKRQYTKSDTNTSQTEREDIYNPQNQQEIFVQNIQQNHTYLFLKGQQPSNKKNG